MKSEWFFFQMAGPLRLVLLTSKPYSSQTVDALGIGFWGSGGICKGNTGVEGGLFAWEEDARVKAVRLWRTASRR